VKTRLPNIKKYDEYNDIIEPLSNELKTRLTDFPVTIVYVESPSICIYVGVAVAVTGRCAAFGKIHVKSPRYLHLGLKSSPLQILNKVIQFISKLGYLILRNMMNTMI
jgi:hypothetical protein